MIKSTIPSSLSLTPRAAPRACGGNMICIAGGRGNIGKSWIAVTLAGLLAKQQKKVLLFDADLGLANIDLQLGLAPCADLDEVLNSTRPLNTAIISKSFDMITGRSTNYSLPGLSQGRLQLVKDDLLLLGAHYDHVVTDLGSNIQKSVRFFAGNIGILLLVCTRDQASLANSLTFIKEVKKNTPNADIRILINDVTDFDEGTQIYNTFSAAIQEITKFNPPLAGIIRTDPYVKKSIAQKLPLLKAYPTCQAVQDVKEVLEKI